MRRRWYCQFAMRVGLVVAGYRISPCIRGKRDMGADIGLIKKSKYGMPQ